MKESKFFIIICVIAKRWNGDQIRMKNMIRNFKWYTIIIIVFFFVYSTLCWGNDVKNIGTFNIQAEGNNIEVLNELIKKYDSHWSGNMFAKKNLSKVDLVLTYFATEQILSDQVANGKEHWLFYKSLTDADPIADYEGTNRYTDIEVKKTLDEVLCSQKEIESRGITFSILVAPNKENIYAEYMPDIYRHAEISSTDILIKNLSDGGINIVSPKEALLDYHLDYQLYYKYDTHWNQLGAYMGVKSILDSWDIEVPGLAERTFTTSYLRENYHYCAIDDLAKMAGLTAVLDDEAEYYVEGTGIVDWRLFEEEQEDGEISHFFNDEAINSSSVLLVGDSFRSSMIPLLNETFSDVYVIHRENYKSEMLNTINPDYMIAEYVERYSSELRNIYSLLIE